jgi:dihydroorotate dehydrogenase
LRVLPTIVLYRAARPLLFRLDPETAHRLVFAAMRPVESLLGYAGAPAPASDPALAQELWGLRFDNPIGLAAGLDKNAELPHLWSLLGFGFAELGTVTAVAQDGNPRPRLFRIPAERALVNRLGFNNAGASAVAVHLARRLARHRPHMPIGINLGKSRITPLERAAADYCASLAAVFELADYVAINISSPNTPGLRDLQTPEQVAALLGALQEANGRLAAEHGRARLPLLVKVAPDLGDSDLAGLVDAARRGGVAGFIATNTTVTRPLRSAGGPSAETGGLSGAPLRAMSTRIVRSLRSLVGPELPIIGAGGVSDANHAYEKIRAGASLVQLYTGLVYEGPGLPRRLARGLAELLRRDGFARVSEAVGSDAGATLDRLTAES